MNEDIMFDFSSYYDKIAEQMPDNCRVCEVGVANCDSLIYLCNKLKGLGKNFSAYAVDSMEYGKYEQLRDVYKNIIKNGLGDFIEVLPYPSIEAAQHFNDGFLHFCFIDASHLYEQTKEDIKVWYPKVLDEFIISGHDYETSEGVKKAVDELLPKEITRPAISAFDTFESEQLLYVYNTNRNYGIWEITKRFWWKP